MAGRGVPSPASWTSIDFCSIVYSVGISYRF